MDWKITALAMTTVIAIATAAVAIASLISSQ